MYALVLFLCAAGGGACGPVQLPTQYATREECAAIAVANYNADRNHVKDYYCAPISAH